jgi:SAM-dependent methyltransferase
MITPPKGKDSGYDDAEHVARRVAAGKHRETVGGLWDEVGQLQLDYLVSRGLKPRHKLLDLGCGALRGGVRFAGYLDPGHYYGVDLNQSLMDAGYEKEIVPAGLAERLPRENLYCIGDFRIAQIGQRFDFVLAQSVFTHIRLERIRECLARVVKAVRPGGAFFATYWRVPEDHPDGAEFRHARGGVITYPDKNNFHYKFSALAAAAEGLPWDVEDAGEWNHPRDQQMIVFRRHRPPAPAAA